TATFNYAGEDFQSDNCGSPGIGKACSRSNLQGSKTFNPNNFITNVDVIKKVWDVNPSIGGPIVKNKVWFNYSFRNLGSTKTKTGAYFDKNPSQFIYDPAFTKPGLDDGHNPSHDCAIS